MRNVFGMSFLTAIVAIVGLGQPMCHAGNIALQTPSGLNPGDHFRFIFVTTGTTNATSADISTYDAFVNSDAGGATYNGSVVTWQAIGSTSSVNAIDHIGVTGNPVYNPSGTMVVATDSTSGLWSGNPLLTPPDQYLNGAQKPELDEVWTGTGNEGTVFRPLGNTTIVDGVSSHYANNGNPDAVPPSPLNWITGNVNSLGALHHLYGISQELTVPASVVPEPSTVMLAGLGGLVGLAFSTYRRRRAVV